MSVFQEIRDPLVDGLNCEADIRPPIREELMAAAAHKAIDFHWLCAVYRQGVRDGKAASEGVLTMAVARLGGMVEGRPTERVNFLQRVDELVRIEAQALRDQVALRQQVETLEKQRQALYMRQESPTVDQLRDAAHGIDEGDQPSWSDMMSLLGQAANALETEELKNEALQRDQVALREQIGKAIEQIDRLAGERHVNDFHGLMFVKDILQQLTACREEPKP